MADLDLLKKLSTAFGTPGNEGEIRTIIRDELKELCDFDYDKMGSISCSLKNSQAKHKVMLAAHMDEVGFIVKHVTPDGFIKFHNLGGWWPHTLLAQRVKIRTAKGDLIGLIGSKPVHHLGASERTQVMKIEDMYIDIGATSREDAYEMGVQDGDHIVPVSCFMPIRDKEYFIGKAFDDRAGIGLVIEVMKSLANEKLDYSPVGVGTVQEEVGTRGGKTAAHLVNPDVAIILEGTPADDTMGFNKDESQGAFHKGPQIRLIDPTAIMNKKLVDALISTAKKKKIPYQTAVRVSGGTDAKVVHIHELGIPTVVISVPVRYVHSHAGMMARADYESSIELVTEFLKTLNSKTIEDFVDYTNS